MITIRKAGNIDAHGNEKTARKTGLPLSSGLKAGRSFPNTNNDGTVIGTCYEYDRPKGTCTECKLYDGSVQAKYGPCS